MSMVRALNLQTVTQSPKPRQAHEQSFKLPAASFAPMQDSMPVYRPLAAAWSFDPLQTSNGTSCCTAVPVPPVMAESFETVSEPPTGQAVMAAFPDATAWA